MLLKHGMRVIKSSKQNVNIIDIDECEDTVHECSQKCVNEIGTYRCECDEGYNIALDNRTCEGKGFY